VNWCSGTQSAFALSGHSISLSLEPASYNETYASPGPFTGYAPYVGSGAPNVLWFEGTAEMRLATALYGQSTSAPEESMTRWEALTQSEDGAPLQSDQTVNDPAYGVEYHVWPAAAAAAWVIPPRPEQPQVFRRAAAARHHAGHRMEQGSWGQPDHDYQHWGC
jgi:hypothetical protein